MIKAFFKGIYEFRHFSTQPYYDSRDTAYELGREIAHRITFRRWED